MSSTTVSQAPPTQAAAVLAAYIRDVNSTPLLSAQQEKSLGARIQRGDPAARDLMVRANLRFVIRLARKYQGRGLSLEDLIQEGNLGLMRAAEAFDPERGTRFSTYAKYWIIQSIQRALYQQARTVRVPHYAHGLANKYRAAERQLTDLLGRQPTEVEVAARIGATLRQSKIIQEVLRIQEPGHGAGQGTEAGAPLDKLADWRQHGPEAPVSQREELDKMVAMIDRLDEREMAILRLRYGLNGGEPMTLLAIGTRLSLTRERVRQLEVQALRKLRQELDYELN